jgi:hypothetical protein
VVAAFVAVSNASHAKPVVPPPVVPVVTGPALAVDSIDQVMPLITKARLTAAVAVDGGAVTVRPTSGDPKLTEAKAVRIWAAGDTGGGAQQVSDPVVFLADATLTAPLERSPDSVAPRPRVDPRFVHRQAWVFMWNTSKSVSFGGCPYYTLKPGATTTPVVPDAIGQVELLAADGSQEGVTYQRASPWCGQIHPPSAEIAAYALSVPWTYAATANGQSVAQVALPPCALLGGASTSSDHAVATTSVWVDVMMVRSPCTGGDPGSAVQLSGQPGPLRGPPQPTGEPGHGATGLLLGRVTSLGGDGSGAWSLTYFDGRNHTIT